MSSILLVLLVFPFCLCVCEYLRVSWFILMYGFVKTPLSVNMLVDVLAFWVIGFVFIFMVLLVTS